MSQLLLNRGVSARQNLVNKLIRKFQPGPYFLIGSLVAFVALITVITLMFSTQQVTKGYQLSELEAMHQDLVRNSEVKDMEISQVRSLQFIEESPKVQGMVVPGQVVFIEPEVPIAKK